jgi:hypothetical protein
MSFSASKALTPLCFSLADQIVPICTLIEQFAAQPPPPLEAPIRISFPIPLRDLTPKRRFLKKSAMRPRICVAHCPTSSGEHQSSHPSPIQNYSSLRLTARSLSGNTSAHTKPESAYIGAIWSRWQCSEK